MHLQDPGNCLLSLREGHHQSASEERTISDSEDTKISIRHKITQVHCQETGAALARDVIAVVSRKRRQRRC
jgi:hypothetical protein